MLRSAGLVLASLAVTCSSLGVPSPAGVPAGDQAAATGTGASFGTSRARPVLVPQLGHAGAVTSVAMSPDRHFVVTGGRDGTVRLWHAETGHELRRLDELTTRRMHHVVADFSPDGERVVFASIEALGVVDLARNELLWDTRPGVPVDRPTFSADGETVMLCRGAVNPDREGNAAIELRAADTGALEASITIPDRAFGGVGPAVCAWSADRRSAAVGFFGPTAQAMSIGVWDLDSRRLRDRLEGAATGIRALHFSPHGSRILAVAGRQLLVWDRSRPGAALPIAELVDDAVFLSSDDDLAFVRRSSPGTSGSAEPYAVRLTHWSLSANRAVRDAQGQFAKPNLPMRVHEGLLFTGCWTRVDLWEVAKWQKLRSLSNSELGPVDMLQVSDDERYLLIVFKGEPRSPQGFLVDLERGEVVRQTESDPRGRFALDGQGRFVIEGGRARDLRSHEIVGVGHDPPGALLGMVSGGLVLVSDNLALSLWEPLTDTVAWRWPLPDDAAGTADSSAVPPGHRISVRVAAVTPDRRLVATAGADDREVRVWDGASGDLRGRLDHGGPIRSVQLSADGSRLLATGVELRVWDVAAGGLLLQPKEVVTSARFARGGQAVIATLADGQVLLYNVATGERQRLTRHTGSATAALLLERRGLVVSGGNDKSVRFWDLRAGRDPLVLAIPRRNQWAVIDASGRFDSSAEAGDSFVWVAGNEPIELGQLRARYYEPHLLAKFLADDAERLRDVSLFQAPNLYPTVEFQGPTADDLRIEILVSDQGGGIGEVPVYLNGRELTPDARTLPSNRTARVVDGKLRLLVDIRGDSRLRAVGENRVEVFAFERENFLRSRSKGRAFFGGGSRVPTVPRLWAVVVGVSDYTGNEIDLRYSARDAVGFSKALTVAGERLLGPGRTDIKLLSTAAPTPAGQPTRANIMAALQRLSRSAQDDIVVVYFSGHGVSLGNEKGDYYFLASEARSFGLADPEISRRVAVSGNQLAEIMKAIPADKRAIILDTCSAGRFVQIFGDSRFPPDDQARALQHLQERTGFHVLAGAAAGNLSWEASRFSQGLLTYSLLFGMRGAALDSQKRVDVIKLFEYAATEVPTLAAQIHGVQRPLHASPGGGTSFPIGRVLPEDAEQIPLEAERAVFVRTQLHHATQFRDSLRLSERLNALLRDRAAPDPASGRARIVFVDDDTYPHAIEITGQYGDDGRISAILYRDVTEIRRISVTMDPANPKPALEELVRQVLAEVAQNV